MFTRTRQDHRITALLLAITALLAMTLAGACRADPPPPANTAAPVVQAQQTAEATPVPAEATPMPEQQEPTAKRPKRDSQTPVEPKTTTAPTAKTPPEEPVSPTGTPANNPTPHMAQELTDQPGRPANPENTLKAIQMLPQEELDCLPPDVMKGRVELSLQNVGSQHHAQVLRAVADCVSDQSIVRLMMIPGLQEQTMLQQEEEQCLMESNSGAMVRLALSTDGQYPQFTDAAFIAIVGILHNAQECLSPDKFAKMDIPEKDMLHLFCIIPAPQDALALITAIVEDDQVTLNQTKTRAIACAQEYPPTP